MQSCVIWRHCSVILKDGLGQTTKSVVRPEHNLVCYSRSREWRVAAAPGCLLCMFLNSEGIYVKEIALTHSRIVLSVLPVHGHSLRNHFITADPEYYNGCNSLVCRGGLNVMLWTVYRKVAFARKHYWKSRRCYGIAIRLQLAFLSRLETGALGGGSNTQYSAMVSCNRSVELWCW